MFDTDSRHIKEWTSCVQLAFGKSLAKKWCEDDTRRFLFQENNTQNWSINSNEVCRNKEFSFLETWHMRLRHPSLKITKHVMNLVSNKYKNIVLDTSWFFCTAYQLEKIHKLTFINLVNKRTEPLEIIHFSIRGQALIVSSLGFKWYAHFIDEYSKLFWFNFLKKKSNCMKVFVMFRVKVELLTRKKFKMLQIDREGEYNSLMTFLRSHGIERKNVLSIYYWENGLVEWMHK